MLREGVGGYRRYIDDNIKPIEDRSRDAFLVIADLNSRTSTFVIGVVEVAARAGIHGGDESEACGVAHALFGTRDGDRAAF